MPVDEVTFGRCVGAEVETCPPSPDAVYTEMSMRMRMAAEMRRAQRGRRYGIGALEDEEETDAGDCG